MSKHKKHLASDPPGPSPADFSEIENRLASDDGRSPSRAKKEISGAWVLIFLLGLLVLLVLQHWLRQ